MVPSGELTYIAIENGHRNSGFSHEKWWIVPLQTVSSPEGKSKYIMGNHHKFWDGTRGHDAIRCCLRWGRSSSNTGPGSQLDTSKEKNISKGRYKLVGNHGTLINFMALKCLEYLQVRFGTYMGWLWWGWLFTSLVLTTSDYVVDVTLLTCLTTWRQPMILDHFGRKPKRPPFSVIRP